MKFARPTILALLCTASAFTGVGINCAAAKSALIEELAESADLHPSRNNVGTTQCDLSGSSQGGEQTRAQSVRRHVGADVPPIIDLYVLSDDILATVSETPHYKFTEVNDQVVLVDPTKIRVIAVIGPITLLSSGGVPMPLTGAIPEGRSFFCPHCRALYAVTYSRFLSRDTDGTKCVVCGQIMDRSEFNQGA